VAVTADAVDGDL